MKFIYFIFSVLFHFIFQRSELCLIKSCITFYNFFFKMNLVSFMIVLSRVSYCYQNCVTVYIIFPPLVFYTYLSILSVVHEFFISFCQKWIIRILQRTAVVLINITYLLSFKVKVYISVCNMRLLYALTFLFEL